MAVAQHQFCLERRDNKTYLHPVRSMSEIAAELSHSSTSLSGSGASDLSRSTSSHSLPSLSASRYDVNIDPEKVKKEMYQALKERQEALKEALRKKNEEFKQLCIQEGELIGHLPKDTPLAPGEQPPIIRRRVKTAFSLSSKLVPKDGEDMEDQLARLDLEYELQSKITSAAYKLAHDRSVSKQVRKQRKQVYHKAQTKLKDMEKTLNEMKKKAGHSTLKPCPVYEESEIVSPSPSPIPRPKKDYSQTGFTNNMEVIQDDPTYDPLVTDREERISPLPPGSPSHLSPSHSSPQLKGGYTPSSVYSTGTQYRNQRYPTFTNRTGPPPVGGEYLASNFFKYSEKLRRARMLDSYQRQLIGDDRLVHLSKLAQQTDSSVNSYYSSSYTSEHSSSSSPVSSFSRIQQVTPSSPYMAYHHSQVQHHQSSSPQQQTQPQSTPSSPFPQYWREFEQHAGTTFPLQRGGTPGVLGSGSGMSSMSSRTVTSSYHHSVSSSSSSSSSSHIQYSSAQSVSRVFRSHQVQTSRHTQYQPPQPMTCEPVAVRDIPSPGSNPGTGSPANLSNLSSQPPTPSEGGQLKSRDNSFTFETGESLADAFSEEMLAWSQIKFEVNLQKEVWFQAASKRHTVSSQKIRLYFSLSL
ncbi:FERM domain-containing protein 4A [Acanthosepion pharaonis]|uniref:FERM domain-containing protein 4A n=1 Tax=Acanthosepion pharaonis TaxID=158019 RepID=A0A812D6X3_ACAPH|nr:FERM domain-containing protein 4A [Sepia pharaonis]